MRGNGDLTDLVWNDHMLSLQCDIDRHISNDDWFFCENIEIPVVYTSTEAVENLIQGAVKETSPTVACLDKFLMGETG
jgi:hypothetical protein